MMKARPSQRSSVPGPVASGRSEDDYVFVPLGRAALTEEVADLVRYLGADDSSYLTDGDFTVDGGLTAGGGPRGNDSRSCRPKT